MPPPPASTSCAPRTALTASPPHHPQPPLIARRSRRMSGEPDEDYHEAMPSGSSPPKRGKRREVVAVACTNCRRSGRRCANERPCPRCVEKGLTDCIDRPATVRGVGGAIAHGARTGRASLSRPSLEKTPFPLPVTPAPLPSNASPPSYRLAPPRPPTLPPPPRLYPPTLAPLPHTSREVVSKPYMSHTPTTARPIPAFSTPPRPPLAPRPSSTPSALAYSTFSRHSTLSYPIRPNPPTRRPSYTSFQPIERYFAERRREVSAIRSTLTPGMRG